MENFKEIAEKCLAGELSGTFITAFDNNWHSRYLQRYTIPGHEMPKQYVLGPGIIYNDMGQCTSNEKVKIVDFIPDTMKNFKEIAEKCANGEIYGTIILDDGREFYSKYLSQYIFNEKIVDGFYTIGLDKYLFHVDQIIDFIPNNMQEQIKIDIPEGKVPIMEQTESGVVITWKEKELTYEDIKEKLSNDKKYISNFGYNTSSPNLDTHAFYQKMGVLHKLTNIRNYFGKPDSYDKGYCIEYYRHQDCLYVGNVNTIGNWTCDVLFKEKEHAEQAIKMLGDELKYLFEPW